MIRNCPGCGTSFETLNLNKTRCTKNCGRTSRSAHQARTNRRAAGHLDFIGVDGEGVTRPDGTHIYDMLSVGDNTLTSPDGSQLQWEEIFDFLWENHSDNPSAVFVGFFLGYDFTQWLRTLPQNRAAMLLTPTGRAIRARTHTSAAKHGPFPVRHGAWEFDILGMKRFKLRKLPYPGHDGKGIGWMNICDVGSFFATSFLNVIDPRGWDTPVCTADEYDTVTAGKADRGRRQTHAEQLASRADTARYNTLENAILSRVMGRLNEGLVSAGIHLGRTQWYGPGQASQTWMDNIGAPTAEHAHDTVPRWALEAGRDAYYGGWFEIFAHGHIPGPTYEYDINSAYPHAIAELPCLCGTWTRGQPGDDRPTLALVDATTYGSNTTAGALPHRTAEGRILRPQITRGWRWSFELDAAMDADLLDHIDVHQWIGYTPCTHAPPLRDAMRKLYRKRLEAGKNSPEGKAYKLVYNSAYGKMAQSIGSPKYANPLYASYITAHTRSAILRAIATHPAGTTDLLMVATDGVYFRTPHPDLELSPTELGKWDMTIKHNLTIMMPGLYWDDNTRQRLAQGDSPKLKSRGISAGDLASRIAELDTSFTQLAHDGSDWPTCTIPLAFSMTTATQALHRNAWHTAGTLTHDAVKTISADPTTKRHPDIIEGDHYLRTDNYQHAPTLQSHPYTKQFGLPDEDDGINPDGTTMDALRQALLH